MKERSYFNPLALREELLGATRRQYERQSQAGMNLRHVVYRKVWLRDADVEASVHPRQGNSPIGMDTFILISPLGARPRVTRLSPGYRREEYETFDEAVEAVTLSTPQFAVERWARHLLREHAHRAERQRAAREAAFGRDETLTERNARHRQAHAASGLSANAYARLHDGDDGLSQHQLRRIVSARAVQKTTSRRTRST